MENSERDGNTTTRPASLRNLYAGQEATVRTGHGTRDWFQIGKGVRQGCILSPCLFNLYAVAGPVWCVAPPFPSLVTLLSSGHNSRAGRPGGGVWRVEGTSCSGAGSPGWDFRAHPGKLLHFSRSRFPRLHLLFWLHAQNSMR